jgi:hypothetical protein
MRSHIWVAYHCPLFVKLPVICRMSVRHQFFGPFLAFFGGAGDGFFGIDFGGAGDRCFGVDLGGDCAAVSIQLKGQNQRFK